MTAGLLKTLPVLAIVIVGIILPDYTRALPLAAEEVHPTNSFTIDWQSVIGTMGVTGVLVWYLWYTTSSANPKARQDFREEMSVERQYHTAERAKDRETLVKAFDRMDKICDSLNGLSGELRKKPCLLGEIEGVNVSPKPPVP